MIKKNKKTYPVKPSENERSERYIDTRIKTVRINKNKIMIIEVNNLTR